MATVSPMDAAEHERLSKFTCPKSRGKCPAWMLGNPFTPARISGPKKAELKVSGADRKVYDRCAAAMMAGRLFSWSIDAKTGNFLVRVVEEDDWSELMRHEVAELLDGLGVDGAPAVAKATKVVPAVVAAPAAEVVEISSARSSGGTWPEPVTEYVGRLVFAPKKEYAAALAAHLLDGAARPADPGTEWAEKVRTKFDRLAPALSSEQVA